MMREIKLRSLVLLKGLGLSFGIFTLCRIIYLIFNLDAFSRYPFSEIAWSFIIGIWFDAVPVFYYNILFLLLLILPHVYFYHRAFRKAAIGAFLLGNGLATFQNLSDVAYFPYNKKRTGAEIFQLSKEWNFSQLLSYITDFWYLLLIFFLICFISYKLLKKYLFQSEDSVQAINKSSDKLYILILRWISFIAVCSTVTLLGMRGGFGLIPLRTFDASRYVDMSLVPLAINTPMQLISTIEGSDTPEMKLISETVAIDILKPVKNYKKDGFQSKNVVIIIVESLGKEYMGFYNNGKGYTPFLDSLCKTSLTFQNSFSNGTTSMDAPPAIFSGIANILNDSYIISRNNTNSPNSIGKQLKTQGYNSSFYHAGENGTMGFDNYLAFAGMGDYFGLKQYPYKGDNDGVWGIFDEPYLQYYAEELNKKKTPFLSAVFTLSSHHPYTIPAKYKGKLPIGNLKIQTSIAYADLSLKHFFKKAEKMPWYKNTLFIITGDHTSDSENPAYQTPIGRYAIPFIFFCASDDRLKGTNNNVMQQSLILPTVLDYLNYPQEFKSLGKSAFREDSYAVFYSGGSYTLLQNDFALVMTPDKETYLFNYKQDPYFQKVISDNKSVEQNMENILKSYLQLYIKYMREDTF